MGREQGRASPAPRGRNAGAAPSRPEAVATRSTWGDARSPPAPILPPCFSRRIFRVAWLSLPTSLASAIYNQLYDSIAISALVFLTSLNYWRHPTAGTRRNLDMAATWSSLSYQVFYRSAALPGRTRAAYFASVLVCGGWYAAARHHGRVKRDFDTSSACHVMLHVFGNVSNLMLYDALGTRALGRWSPISWW